jgi:hypothetical protein
VTDKLAERLGDPKVARDTRLLGDFAVIYCEGRHRGRERKPLTSRGAELGVYGRRAPHVFDECAELLEYAEKRRAFCPQDKPGNPKPFCSHCPTHCYKPEMRELMRHVMRYAGPRSMLHGHAIDGVRHMIEGRRHRAALRRSEAVTQNRSQED